MSIELKTPQDVQRELAGRFKARRLSLNLTQEGLAARSGVSWSSLKRFEHTGSDRAGFPAEAGAGSWNASAISTRYAWMTGRTWPRNRSTSFLSQPKARRKGRIK
jgi:transcriptional regulator with XRE-family HTH domain